MATMTPHDRLRQRDREMIPKVLLRAMFALVLSSLAIVTYARLTDRPLEAAPPADVAVAKERLILLYGDMSGSARVLDPNGSLIADLPPSEGGFISGVWRVLQRVRTQHRVALDAPVRLVLWQDGRLSILDDTTGWRAELTGFGADNLAAFARLLN
ncbi:MAG: photosynthetic complex assembly protein PuhC [Rhodobacteraceae bacterium]|nr:photosynthetic complex assembly protein PuhC [Paracoccaceae bacterium]